MVEWLITETHYQGMWEILPFLISSGEAWILSTVWFKQKRVRTIGTGEMNRRLSMVLLYIRLEGLLPNDTLFVQQALPKQPSVSCPASSQPEPGAVVAAEGTCRKGGKKTLKCLSHTLVCYTWGVRWKKRVHQSLLWVFKHKGAVMQLLYIHRDRDKAHCPRCLNKSTVIFPCHCVIDSFLYLISLETVTTVS